LLYYAGSEVKTWARFIGYSIEVRYNLICKEEKHDEDLEQANRRNRYGIHFDKTVFFVRDVKSGYNGRGGM
jgi:hypothetical protein